MSFISTRDKDVMIKGICPNCKTSRFEAPLIKNVGNVRRRVDGKIKQLPVHLCSKQGIGWLGINVGKKHIKIIG